MLKVSNRNTRKRCLLISKIILKTSERCHLTTSYLPEVTVENHTLDSLQCQFAIKSLPSVLLSSLMARNFNNSRPTYEKSEIITELLIHEKFKMPAFFISEKTTPKNGQIFQFFTFRGTPFEHHKVRHKSKDKSLLKYNINEMSEKM